MSVHTNALNSAAAARTAARNASLEDSTKRAIYLHNGKPVYAKSDSEASAKAPAVSPMQDMLEEVAQALDMNVATIRTTFTGLTDGMITATATPRGVKLEDEVGDIDYVDGFVLRVNLNKLLVCPILMREEIRDQLTNILNKGMGMRLASCRYKVDGKRVICISGGDTYRINVETFNITKLVNLEWIVQERVEYVHTEIEKLEGMLVQVNLM